VLAAKFGRRPATRKTEPVAEETEKSRGTLSHNASSNPQVEAETEKDTALRCQLLQLLPTRYLLAWYTLGLQKHISIRRTILAVALSLNISICRRSIPCADRHPL